MSYSLYLDLSGIVVHMESVLDRRLNTSDALVLAAEMASKLSSMQIDNEKDASRLEVLEREVDQLTEQIS